MRKLAAPKTSLRSAAVMAALRTEDLSCAASRALAAAHKQALVGAAAHDRFARLDVTELTIELATCRWPDQASRDGRRGRSAGAPGLALHMQLVGTRGISRGPGFGDDRGSDQLGVKAGEELTLQRLLRIGPPWLTGGRVILTER
jgi:hypothetical protein